MIEFDSHMTVRPLPDLLGTFASADKGFDLAYLECLLLLIAEHVLFGDSCCRSSSRCLWVHLHFLLALAVIRVSVAKLLHLYNMHDLFSFESRLIQSRSIASDIKSL